MSLDPTLFQTPNLPSDELQRRLTLLVQELKRLLDDLELRLSKVEEG